MADQSYIVVDKIKWFITNDAYGHRVPQALCPQHHLRINPVITSSYNPTYRRQVKNSTSESMELECAEGPHRFQLPRKFGLEEVYVIDRLDALVFEKTTFMYLDDVAIPVAIDKIDDKESTVWVRAKVTQSKSGLRLIVWAGDKSANSKTQLFLEPEIKRMSFDQNDDHLSKVFVKVDALFADNVKAEISQ